MRFTLIGSAALLFAVIGGLAAAPAWAQPNPSVEEMVKSLSPTPGGPQTRGIRIGQPRASASA